MPSYTEEFKARMVQRMAGPEAISATALAHEVGVSQNTLSRWLRQASEAAPTVAAMKKKKHAAGKGPHRRRTAEEKLQLVIQRFCRSRARAAASRLPSRASRSTS